MSPASSTNTKERKKLSQERKSANSLLVASREFPAAQLGLCYSFFNISVFHESLRSGHHRDALTTGCHAVVKNQTGTFHRAEIFLHLTRGH
jgi:hypothetical protein